ncbi:DegT/DnrJ/EryC1/StrS family aminotransferase [Phenylobacterium sp.]|uniref:DegT/DnrJ/EryC1/StrS family aminotransferase n=1 Tax=Phenylobacterium sp. TaxID=1871053 RepID=UPI0035C8289C
MTEPSPIAVAAPMLDGNERDYVLECLESSWISSSGRFLDAFEAAFAERCGVRHAIATNNGTTALHLALLGLGIGPGDEVIVPDLTYIASANAVRYCGATPVFVDNERWTMNLDPALVTAKVTSQTRAIMPVHLYGHPVDMDPILALSEQHNLLVVEDAAEAVGARYKGRPVGGLGNCATFSFFGNKIITTGEGGMVTTNDDALAERLRLLRSQGMDPKRRYWFPVVGYNYRMTNLAAAIGLAQLERIDAHLAARRHVAQGYDARLKRLEDQVIRPVCEPWADHVYWMYTILLREPGRRDAVMAAMAKAGVETRPVFHPMHTLPPYFEADGYYPNADWCAGRGINLPTHGGLTEADLDRVVTALEEALATAV